MCLLHPSDSAYELVTKMMITKDVAAMSLLQKEMPILLYLLRHFKDIPKVLTLILQEIITKVKATFKCNDISTTSSEPCSVLAYFPKLSKIRIHGR